MGPIPTSLPSVAYDGFPELVILFQPIVDLANQRVTIYEALTRGFDGRSYPQLIEGMSPARLRSFHLRSAYRALYLAAQAGIAKLDCQLSLNIQPDIEAGALDACFIQRSAAHHGIATSQIILELTEDHKLPVGDLQALIARNRNAGFVMAMDEFGTGYGGLTTLIDCRPKIVKLDRGLIHGIAESSARRGIVGAFVDVAQSLNVVVIAEGVETFAERDALRDLGVTLMQGYLFSPPISVLIPWQPHWLNDTPNHSPSKVVALNRRLKKETAFTERLAIRA